MTKLEAKEFIERMGEFGDEWTEEQVIRVYENRSLQEALNDRFTCLKTFSNVLDTAFNN